MTFHTFTVTMTIDLPPHKDRDYAAHVLKSWLPKTDSITSRIEDLGTVETDVLPTRDDNRG